MFDAMRHVVGEDFFLGPPQRGAHRRKLGDDVDTIAIVLDHSRETAHLPFDPVQAFEHRRLGNRLHGVYIPLPGTRFKRIIVQHLACSHHTPVTDAATADPVCGMRVDPVTAKHRHSYRDHDYFFCCAGCREKFVANPERYLRPNAAPHPKAATSTDAIYTCPMHPEIRQHGPGHCPICGMALEPEAGGEADDGERIAMMRRLWISAVLAAPVVALDMGAHFGAWHFSGPWPDYVQFALATPVVLWGGWPFFVRGAQSIVTRNLNMFTLIAMGTGVAYLYSVVAVLAPGLFPAGFRNAHGGLALYFEAAAVITVLVLLGQVLELSARASTSGAIRALMNLAPQRRGASASTAAMKMCHSMPLWPAIGSASAPAKEFQLTASCSTAVPLWMNRW